MENPKLYKKFIKERNHLRGHDWEMDQPFGPSDSTELAEVSGRGLEVDTALQ